ncbi:YbaB/EbfC family nucleoid-associated protein [Saccharopolyspora sp. K220]|uniref:YbaB/EbfC family nucleoid-associated protein n=1 Tax=Saccharopolyspora soli TaxID=2926618 RepID=UPI001F56EE68|nr:YbaB/EbfC family nucleoid-associated protein [Saccharopolyspora soli]MCI2415795.1 YbaB/EbfC family nucleoid-associated protein [Saccharopolyspora soli]
MLGDSQSGLVRDPDEAQRRIEQWAQGFAEKAQRYQAVQQQTEQLRLTATSPDGRVKVTVRADGSVSDLEFTEKIRSMPLQELSAQILSTMQQAQANIATRVGDVLAEQLGDEDLQTRSVVLDNLRERFPEPPEESEPEPGSGKWDFAADDETPEQPTPPAPTPPPAAPPTAPGPQQRRRPGGDGFDDDDFPDDFDPLRD